MQEYTICPNVVEYLSIHKKNLYDLLYVFVPANSKKICIDSDEKIINTYKKIIQKDRDLATWFDLVNKRKESSFLKIPLKNEIEDLVLDICSSSPSKKMIVNSIINYKDQFDFIRQKEIEYLEINQAAFILNYGNLSVFPSVDLSKFNPVTPDNILDLVIEISKNFKDLIELNGLYKLLYEKDNSRVDEKKAQLLFYAVAFTYCSANNLKLSPEVNSGNGPVDFNISQGLSINVNVEIKFADNPKLENGFWYQLRTYNQAERTNKSIYLVLKDNDNYDQKIGQLKSLIKIKESEGQVLPYIYEIDYRKRPSASNQTE
jgi:hypothetical protein